VSSVNLLSPGNAMPPYDDDETVRCIRCRKFIFEGSVRCPYCGHYQVEDERNRKPMWFIVTVIAVIVCILLFFLGLIEFFPW